MNMYQWTRIPDFTKITDLDYDEYWLTRGFRIRDRLRERETLMRDIIPTGSKVLDLGCGNSFLPVELKGRGCDVSVGDVSKKVLEGYKEKGVNSYPIDLNQPLDTSRPPLDQKYDFIILSEVLEHLPHPERVIKQLAPCTKRFLITIPNSAFFRFRLGLLLRGRFFTQWVHHPSEHLRFWSHIDFLDWLKAMGLRVVSSKASNGPKVAKDWWPNMFGFQMVYDCACPENTPEATR